MKQFIIILAAIITLTSCQQIADQVNDYVYTKEMSGHTLYNLPEFANLHSHYDIARWIKAHVTYDYNDDETDYKDPEETIRTGKGSCADFSILFVNIAYFALNEKLSIVFVEQSDMKLSRHIVDGGDIDHATPYDGTYLISEYNGYNYTCDDIGFIYHFGDIF